MQDPVNLYGLTKVVGERLCLDYLTEFGVPIVMLRYGGVSSPDERAGGRQYLLSGMIQRFRDAKMSHNNYLWINLLGHDRPWEWLEPLVDKQDQLVALTDKDGRPWLSHPTDVRDVIQGTVLALESEAGVGEAFRFWSGPGIQYRGGPPSCRTDWFALVLRCRAGAPCLRDELVQGTRGPWLPSAI